MAARSVLVVLGVFCKRAWLLFTSFITPNMLGVPGIILGSSVARGATGVEEWAVYGGYAPTMIEVMVVVGVLSLAVLAFIFLVGDLIVKPREEKKAAAASEVEALETEAAAT